MEKLRIYQKELGAQIEQNKVLHFGDLGKEVSLFNQKPLLMDYTHLGVISVKGADRLSFFNRLVTAELKDLKSNQMVEGIWTNAKGRFEQRIHFYSFEAELWLITEQSEISKCLKKVEMYHFSEDIEIKPLDFSVLWLQGPKSASLIEKVFGVAPTTGTFNQIKDTCVSFCPRFQASEGYEIVASHSEIHELYQRLVEAGASPIGEEARHLFRIKTYEPEIEAELTNDIIPLEIPHLESWVSFDKGCYPGQEVLARMHNLGHPNKVLSRFSLETNELPPVNTKIFENENLEKEVGFLTSISNFNSETTALGYLRWKLRDSSAPLCLILNEKKVKVSRIP